MIFLIALLTFSTVNETNILANSSASDSIVHESLSYTSQSDDSVLEKSNNDDSNDDLSESNNDNSLNVLGNSYQSESTKVKKLFKMMWK